MPRRTEIPTTKPQIKTAYSDLAIILARYWTAYGGWAEWIRSPFVHMAILLTVLTSGYWLSSPWYSTSISVLPNLLGFGVTGYAIWIGWGDESFRAALIDIRSGTGVSGYVEISATFAHFAVVQIIALVSAILYAALDYRLSGSSWLGQFFLGIGLPVDALHYVAGIAAGWGFFFFIYAIAVTLEATLALFRLATWFQLMKKAPPGGPSSK